MNSKDSYNILYFCHAQLTVQRKPGILKKKRYHSNERKEGENMIRLNHVSKIYGDGSKKAVDDLRHRHQRLFPRISNGKSWRNCANYCRILSVCF